MFREMKEIEFQNVKTQLLNKNDLSKKGAIDEKITDLINLINSNKNYVTSSSCSGRIVVFSKDTTIQKKGCIWIYNCHDVVDEEEFLKSIFSNVENESLVIKFEPFILHCLCRTLADAKSLLTCGLNAGYRNSGITLGKNNKITVAIRSTINLEIPIVHSGKLLVTTEYLKFLAGTINSKMNENFKQIEKFTRNISQYFLLGNRAKQFSCSRR